MIRPSSIALAALALAACGAPPAKPDAVVPIAELPPRHQEVWRAYHAGGAPWIVERERVLDDPELARFLVDNLVGEMVRAYDRSRLAVTGRKDGPFERARAELVVFHEESTPVLVELVRIGDGVVAFLARDVLVEIGAESVGASLGLLADRDERVRQRGAELQAELGGPAAPEVEEAARARLVELVADDPSWAVRALAAKALGRRGRVARETSRARVALVAALGDDDPAVVQAAVEALADLGDPRGVPSLIEAYEAAQRGGQLKTLQAARRSLRALTGTDRESPDAWRAFWQAERGRLLQRAEAGAR